MTFITRFAPSPTGYLHLGNIRTAIFNWLAARRLGGFMQLRLEDTDQMRGQAHFAVAIEKDLAWLGLDWHGVTGGDGRPWRQSERGTIYEAALKKLREQVYPCFCSPDELAASRAAMLKQGCPPRYSGKCAVLAQSAAAAKIAQGEAAAIRFRMPTAEFIFEDLVHGRKVFRGKDIGDFIIRRASGGFSFFFANAVDDADCGVSHVLRGDDHLANTPRQLALITALSYTPPAYGHIGLMTSDGSPLSKRTGALSVSSLRETGVLPDALMNYLARVGHRFDNSEMMFAERLAQDFDFSALSLSAVRYDKAQLMRRQKDAVLSLSPTALRQWLGEKISDIADHAAFCDAVRDNLVLPEDVEFWVRVVNDEAPAVIDNSALTVIKETAVNFMRRQ